MVNVNEYDTHESYNGHLRNSTERLYNKAQKVAEKDNWGAYKAGKVPGGGPWGTDGRVGAFYKAIDTIQSDQPDLNGLIGTDTSHDA